MMTDKKEGAIRCIHGNEKECPECQKYDLATPFRENRFSAWLSIETAPRESGAEIIGSVWIDGKMSRDPFISFWSPTLKRFFASPTHWIPMPEFPYRPCPYPKQYGDIICKNGELWALTYSEMGPPDSRQFHGECPYCKRNK